MNATTPATLPFTGDPEADALLAAEAVKKGAVFARGEALSASQDPDGVMLSVKGGEKPEDTK